MEAQEMQEQLDKALERAEKAGEHHAFPAWTKKLSLSTAVIAVCTAMSSMVAGHLSGEALMEKNEATQLQAKASDQWAYYQAKGLKSLIFNVRSDIAAGHSSALAKEYSDKVRHYDEEQGKIKDTADGIEKEILRHNTAADRCSKYEPPLTIAEALFQVAIALSAMAVLTWRKPLWFAALAISGLAFVFMFKGFLYFF
jgi:hypothetical protein